MCGRFTLTRRDFDQLAREIGVAADSLLQQRYRARYNVAPGQDHLVLRMQREERELLGARWGLINAWAKDGKRAFQQINARAETVDTRPAFRAAFKARRCAIPADGFFEWTGPRDARRPLWFHRPDGGLIFFAGLYEAWFPRPDEPELTFTVITTEANATLEPVHDRMPVILAPDALDEWLFAGRSPPLQLKALLAPAPDDLLVATPVDRRVNSVKFDDPECLALALEAFG